MTIDPAGLSLLSEDPAIQIKLDEYWNRRSRGYNLATMVALHDTSMYDTMVSNLIPIGKKADVLDIGTSCGFMAIIAAKAGHHVTGIDTVPSMIAAAEHNAKARGLEINFRIMDMNSTDFEDESFDLVIVKSSAWMLVHPTSAFKDWYRILRPGGRMLIIDGNYYLGHYDSDYSKITRINELTDSENKSVHGVTNMDSVNFTELHELSKNLPVSQMRRPMWDVSMLMGIGMEDILVNCTDSEFKQILTSSGYVTIPRNFVVTAKKPSYDQASNNTCSIPINNVDSDEKTLKVLKALSDENRYKLINHLRISSYSVTQLAELTGQSVALVSHNLKILKNVGLVVSTKKGKETIFSIDRPKQVMELLNVVSMWSSTP